MSVIKQIEEALLSDEQVESWRETGGVMVHDLLEPSLVEAVRARAEALYSIDNNTCGLL